MNRKEHSFIRFGEDRIKLDSIEGYGIRTITRYFVRNEAHSEVERNSYEGAFELYNMYDDEPDKSASPMLDISGYPVIMDGMVVQEGHLPPPPKRLMCIRHAHCIFGASRWGANGRSILLCFTRRANAVLTSMPKLPNWMDFSSTSRKTCPTKITGIDAYWIERSCLFRR